jgi:hypothetical protein
MSRTKADDMEAWAQFVQAYPTAHLFGIHNVWHRAIQNKTPLYVDQAERAVNWLQRETRSSEYFHRLPQLQEAVLRVVVEWCSLAGDTRSLLLEPSEERSWRD